MVFTNVINPRSAIPRNSDKHFRLTRVRRGASIGANATIVCEVTIGEFAMIGAGSVVTRDVPDYALVYGNPARQRGWGCYCGETLFIPPEAKSFQSQGISCSFCKRTYCFTESDSLQAVLPEVQPV